MLRSHPRLDLPANIKSDITSSLNPSICTDTFFVMLTISLLDKSLPFQLYRIYNILLLHSILKKSFQYEIEHRYFATRSDLCYLMFPEDKNVLICMVSSEYFCRPDTTSHLVHKIQEYSYFPFEGNKERISKYCSSSILN